MSKTDDLITVTAKNFTVYNLSVVVRQCLIFTNRNTLKTAPATGQHLSPRVSTRSLEILSTSKEKVSRIFVIRPVVTSGTATPAVISNGSVLRPVVVLLSTIEARRRLVMVVCITQGSWWTVHVTMRKSAGPLCTLIRSCKNLSPTIALPPLS